MGWLSGKKTKVKPLILPEQREFLKEGLETSTPGALERVQRAGEPYPGKLTAPITSHEQTGLDTLEGWLGSDMPSDDPLFGMARGEYEKTLGSDYYDPSEGQYYHAYREAVMRELQEAKDRLAAKTSARDQFYSGGRVAGEGELEETAMGDLSLILAQLSERERDRRLGAAPGALDLLGQEEMYPLQRVAGSQEFGGLEREIEQAGLDREKIEWIRQLTDSGIPLEVAMALATHKIDWSVTQEGGEMWDLAGSLAMGAGMAGGIGPYLSGLGGGGGGGLLAGSGFKWG